MKRERRAREGALLGARRQGRYCLEEPKPALPLIYARGTAEQRPFRILIFAAVQI
jgi:hypothetical protein